MNFNLNVYLAPYAPPSVENWLGTDALGQPFLAVLLKSTVWTMLDVAGAASLALLLALLVATFGSVYRQRLGRFVFRIASTFSFATPLIAVLLLLYSVFGDAPFVFPLTVGCLLWGSAALILQTAISQEWQSEYIKAARGFGITRLRLIIGHLLPNLREPLRAAWIASWPAMLSASILTAYLGASGGSPRLGSLLRTGYELFPATWWLWLLPTVIVSASFAALFALTEFSEIRRRR